MLTASDSIILTYQTIAGRSAGQNEVAYWLAMFDLGHDIRDTAWLLIEATGRSPFYELYDIQEFYLNGLGRHPELAALVYWLDQEDRIGLHAVAVEIAVSPESLAHNAGLLS